ncbi:MAG: ribosome maturation factor RimP, partial [Myxococcota bacterium]
MNPIDLQREIRTLIEPTVQRLGFDLVGVEMINGQRGRVLRVSIGRHGGITADHCARVSENVAPVLDQADPIDIRYHLEVSSPGIERPVQRVSDFLRFRG